MAQFYFRTREEAIEDGLLCATACGHMDCAEWRVQFTYPCPYCEKSVEGSAAMIENGRLVHAACAILSVEG